jgi:hypothetical protein
MAASDANYEITFVNGTFTVLAPEPAAIPELVISTEAGTGRIGFRLMASTNLVDWLPYDEVTIEDDDATANVDFVQPARYFRLDKADSGL